MFRRFALLLCAFRLIGCASRESEMDRFGLSQSPSPAQTGQGGAPSIEGNQKMRLGQSVNGRPIEMVTIGPLGGPGVLIMGAIHGDEQNTVDLTRGLIVLLKTRPDLCAGRRVSIIPIANPDGYAQDTRLNANGVDVNRNFPASNYRAGRSSSTRPRYGASAGSEPEARAILRAIELTRPRLIISIHSITNGRQCNNYDGPAEAIAKLMSAKNGYPTAANIGYPTPGSLGSYAGIDRQIPMITLELPHDLPGDQAWAQNKDALLAAITAAK
jgi:protein MpaA